MMDTATIKATTADKATTAKKVKATAKKKANSKRKKKIVRVVDNVFTFCYSGHSPVKSRVLDGQVVTLANGTKRALTTSEINSQCFKDNRSKMVIPEYVSALEGFIKFFTTKKRANLYRLTFGPAYKNLIGISLMNAGTNASIFLGVQDGYLYGKPLCNPVLPSSEKTWRDDYGVEVGYHVGHKYLSFVATSDNVKALLKALPKLFK